MSFRTLLRNKIKVQLDWNSKYSKQALNLNQSSQCVISTKREKLNHYTNTVYSKFDEVPLISKGWNHNKSKNDSFTVHPVGTTNEQQLHSFDEMNIHADLQNTLKQWGVNKATDLQFRAAPTILGENHVMLAAETGCGKTLAYLLPIVQSLIGNKQTDLNKPRAVILVPNRELAYQIGELAISLTQSVNLKAKIVVGGRTKKLMMNPEFEDIDILVGTPGAIGKLSTVGVYKLNEARFLVLDEADTLIDDSFIERIDSIIKRVSGSQIILVSATLPRKLPEVLAPIEQELRHVTSPNLHKPPLNITQKFLRLTRAAKPSYLLKIVKNTSEPMLIFSNRNQTCNWIAMFLRENQVACSNINGDMNYAIRIDQWNQFVRGETRILSATDVGSRGLNTIQIRHVLNYNFPLYAADYLHRVGRVGRIGSPVSCRVTNFISGPEEVALVRQIEYAIRRGEPLTNVDGNITNIVQNRILKNMRESM